MSGAPVPFTLVNAFRDDNDVSIVEAKPFYERDEAKGPIQIEVPTRYLQYDIE
jgi:hypothetical protein